MKAPLLRALSESLSRSRAVVLVRPLEEGPQFLVDHSGVTAFGTADDGGQPPVPEELLEYCRDALARDDARVIEVEQGRYLIQTIAPRPRLIVVGAVHIAQKLIPMAQLAGY